LCIGVGAGKFLGVRRIFAQITPNLPEKNSKENDLQKTTTFHFMLGVFFQIKALQAPSLSKFPPNLPKFPQYGLSKNMTSKKRKKRLHLHLKVFTHFVEIPKLTQILPGF